MISETEAPQELHKNESIKGESRFLRGTILDGLADETTGAISDDDAQLTKFHGIYLQDDRDLRRERRKQKLEKAFMFMVRIRVPGGICTPAQWLEVDRIATEHANDTIKLTTRQAFQLHGVIKAHLAPTIKEINEALLDTVAACGDVNRNVMCNPNPYQSPVHARVQEDAEAISAHLTPQTKAYHEIWVDGELAAGGEPEEEEPIYGKTYLPRKFKTGIAVPPMNDVDVFTQDLGFIAIVEDDELVGYNMTCGGGMGMTHNQTQTFPRLGDVVGFLKPEDIVKVSEAVVTTQRDFGDRVDRKHARLKYTIEDRGVDWFRGEVERRSGIKLEEPRAFRFDSTNDRYGWSRGTNGQWHLNLFLLSGRIKDTDEIRMKTGLREIAKIHQGDFRLTANQNLIVANISDEAKPAIEELLEEYGLLRSHEQSGLRRSALSCVALPTCGLALAESERYLPDLVARLEEVFGRLGLDDDEVTLRITGCPNGCARPYNAEIGLVGRAPGRYNLYLGASFDGGRLNKFYQQCNSEDEVIESLTPIIERYAAERNEGERFGDFTIRAGYVKATNAGRDFHD